MSTKTTLKRIALVAVSALGFGVLSVVPSFAAAPSDTANGDANNYTSATTLSGSSFTVIDTAASTNGATGTMKFYVDTTRTYLVSGASGYTSGVDSNARPLLPNETITVTVVGKTATSQATTDVEVQHLTSTISGASQTFATSGSNANSISVTGRSSVSRNGSFSTVGALNNEDNRYWFALYPDAAAAYNNGAYTIRVRLENANGQVIDKTLTASWVSSIADSGARLTLTNSGTIATGATYAYTENGYTKAVLDNGTTGGRVLVGTSITGALSVSRPTLDANFMTGSTGSVVGPALDIADSGTDGQDYFAGTAADTPSSGVSNSGTAISKANSESLAANSDGTYGIYASSAINATSVPASTTTKIRARLVSSGVSSTVAVVIAPAATATGASTAVTATAAGLKASDTLARTVSNLALTYNVPLTTSAVSLSIDTNGGAGEAITSTVTWSGNYASSNVSPASETEVVNYLDASGKFTVALENKSAVNGGTATVVLKGFASNAINTITINWQKAVVTSVAVIDPVPSVYAKTKSTTVYTVRVLDQFENAMAGEQLIPSLSSTSANYSAATTYAPITTGATGIATWSLTDAAATDTLGDAVTFTSVSDSTKSGSYSMTYKATLPTVAAFYEYYSHTFAATATAAGRAVAVPSTGIVGDAGAGLSLVLARDLSKDLSANDNTGANDDMIAIRVRALTSGGVAATGAAVTLTAPTGGWVIDGSGLPAASRTRAVDSSGDVYFQILATATGTLTWTVTSGTVSDNITLVINDQDKEAGRTVAITGTATGTSNGAGVPMTVTVKDRYGNPVKNVNLTVTAGGVGAFMGGATSQSFTTDKTGTYTFLATSYAAEGGAATFSARATNATDASSIAGYVSTTKVDSTLAAGVSSASATVVFAAGQNASQVAAEAAADAAAEAIDAANAATDAANLAAEAADAATVAAEEARDAADAATAAVEELATQVATLMAALKAQITTLANTVAKIAKKVRA